MPIDPPFIVKYESFIVQPVDAVVNEHVHKAQVDEIKYVRAFAQQLDKGRGEYFFHYRGLGDQTIKESSNGNSQQVIIDDDAEWMMQPGRPASGYGQQRHQPHAKKDQEKADISEFPSISAMKPFAANHQCQFDTDKELEATPEESVEHHKGEIAEKAVPVDVTEDQHQ